MKVWIPVTVANAFKHACIDQNVSMASVITQFMGDFTQTALTAVRPTLNYSTKRQRRAAVATIIKQLMLIRASEEQYRDNIPVNLQGSLVFENAEQSICCIEETLDLLASF